MNVALGRDSPAAAAPLMMAPFQLIKTNERLSSKVEAIATDGRWAIVGTSDSRIIVYEAEAAATTAPHLRQLSQTIDSRRQPIRALTVLREQRRLLSLVGDVVVIRRLPDERFISEELRELTCITGLKDVISISIKQHKRLLTMAVLQRKRLTLYEAPVQQAEFVMKETITLPDGFKSFVWMGRNFMVGGRKEYYFYQLSTASSAALYPSPKSSAAPLLLSMAPVPEVMVSSDAGGMRTLYSDGSLVPGNHLIEWTAAPQDAIYWHPYVLSLHESHRLEVRMPLLTTLETGYPPTCLCQRLETVQLSLLSHSSFTNFDTPMASLHSPADYYTQDLRIALDAEQYLYVVHRAPTAQQVETLAEAGQYEAARLLCQLCPNEVPGELQHRILVACAFALFTQRADYAGCMNALREAGADVRLAIHLFPGFLLADQVEAVASQLPVQQPKEVIVAAIPAFLDYAIPIRRSLSGTSGVLDGKTTTLLKSIDTALVKAYCYVEAKEEALLTLLSHPCWADRIASIASMKEHHQWVALIAFYDALDDFDEAADTLRSLLGASDSAYADPHAPLSPAKAAPLCTWLAAGPFTTIEAENYLPQKEIRATVPSEVSPTDATAVVAAVTSAVFFRRRSVVQDAALFQRCLRWLLGSLPPGIAVSPFFSTANLRQYRVVLQWMLAYDDRGAATPRSEVLLQFFSQLLHDRRVAVTDGTIHQLYWRCLAEAALPCGSNGDDGAKDMLRRSRRDELGQVLFQSPYIDLPSAEEYFEGDQLRSIAIPERAALYRRQGKHREAIEMYLYEAKSLPGARAYATRVASSDSSDAFTPLLQCLLRPPVGPPRVEEALDIMSSCDSVDAAAVLPLLSDDIPLTAIRSFLMRVFREETTTFHLQLFYSSILRSNEAAVQVAAVEAASRCATVDGVEVCPVCQRRIHPGTALSIYPNQVVVHQTCVVDEHLCPITNHDFRLGTSAAMGDV